jgi:hypothetical protein
MKNLFKTISRVYIITQRILITFFQPICNRIILALEMRNAPMTTVINIKQRKYNFDHWSQHMVLSILH